LTLLADIIIISIVIEGDVVLTKRRQYWCVILSQWLLLVLILLQLLKTIVVIVYWWRMLCVNVLLLMIFRYAVILEDIINYYCCGVVWWVQVVLYLVLKALTYCVMSGIVWPHDLTVSIVWRIAMTMCNGWPVTNYCVCVLSSLCGLTKSPACVTIFQPIDWPDPVSDVCGIGVKNGLVLCRKYPNVCDWPMTIALCVW